jgi:hypothetical protein
MGADRTLVAAAGKMGPAKVDYSGLIDGIASVGKAVATKINIANALLAERPEAIEISELPQEMRDANMAFFEESKKEYNDAVKAMKFSAPFTKKYRNAVATINKIKSGYETIKKDLVAYAEYRAKTFTEYTTQSKQANAAQKATYADFVINQNEMNAGVKFTYEGIKFGANELSVRDLPNIYGSSVGIKAGKTAKGIIEKRGGNTKLKGGQFDKSATLEDFTDLVDTLYAEGGWKAVKSLAYDATFNGRSFMQHVGDDLKITYDGQEMSVNDALKLYKDKNPNYTQNSLDVAQANMLADAWGDDQNDILKNDLIDFLYKKAEQDFEDKVYVSPSDRNTETSYAMPGNVYTKKYLVNKDRDLLNSGEDFPTTIGHNKLVYKRENGVYSYRDTDPNSETYKQDVPVTRNSLALMLNFLDHPEVGYIRQEVEFGKPGSEVQAGSYTPFEGSKGQMVDGKLIIFGAVDNKGMVDVRDANGDMHKVKLNDLRPKI